MRLKRIKNFVLSFLDYLASISKKIWKSSITWSICLCMVGYFVGITHERWKQESIKRIEVVKTIDMKKQTYVAWMYENSNESKKTLNEIYDITEQNHAFRDLLISLVVVESGLNHKAASSKGAFGLCQVRSSVWLGELKTAGILKDERDLWDIDTNIAAGSYIFKKYLKKSSGNVRTALTRYVGAEINSTDANVYVDKILKNMGELMLLNMSGIS
mgnify:CR=1 FL=1